MTDAVKVSGLQMNVTKDVAKNITTIKKAIAEAAGAGADILLTPEGSLSGYTRGFNRQEVKDALAEVTAFAKEKNTGLALGTCFEEDNGECYNQIRFYDKAGEFLGFHSKILRCGDPFEENKGELTEFSATPLRTFSFHGLTIGGLICNDMWANPGCTPMDDPHLTTQLKKMGAQIIFHAVNGGRDNSEFSQVTCRNYHESNLCLRAMGSRIWIVTVDSTFPDTIPNSCSGGVVNPLGVWAVQMPKQGENQFACEIPFAEL
ncbi:MAG: carbon-nitrogen hydrolase family protein [Eubacteriales bacterium]